MRIEKAVREVKHWIEKYDYCSNLEVVESQRGKRVKFSARTTRTRASSIVTRIQHIVEDAVEDRGFSVSKALEGEPPPTRGDLATWSIEVFLPLRAMHREAA